MLPTLGMKAGFQGACNASEAGMKAKIQKGGPQASPEKPARKRGSLFLTAYLGGRRSRTEASQPLGPKDSKV